MIASVQQIKYELMAFIKELGGGFGEFVIGIADDPRQAMRREHGVDLEGDPWIYKQALSHAAARTVQDYFVEKLKVNGVRPASDSEDVDCVYLYRKGVETCP